MSYDSRDSAEFLLSINQPTIQPTTPGPVYSRGLWFQDSGQIPMNPSMKHFWMSLSMLPCGYLSIYSICLSDCGCKSPISWPNYRQEPLTRPWLCESLGPGPTISAIHHVFTVHPLLNLSDLAFFLSGLIWQAIGSSAQRWWQPQTGGGAFQGERWNAHENHGLSAILRK